MSTAPQHLKVFSQKNLVKNMSETLGNILYWDNVIELEEIFD